MHASLQAYIQKLGTCLLEVEEHQTAEAEQALTKLSMEAAALVCCLVHFNADTVKALYGLRLDNGQPVPHQPGDAFYSQLVVSSYGSCLFHVRSKSTASSCAPNVWSFLCKLRLDNGQPVPHQPGDAFYSQLVVSPYHSRPFHVRSKSSA